MEEEEEEEQEEGRGGKRLSGRVASPPLLPDSAAPAPHRTGRDGTGGPPGFCAASGACGPARPGSR